MPQLDYGTTFDETGIDGKKPQSWDNYVMPFLQTVRTLTNTTKMDYLNVQDDGLRTTNMLTHANVEAVRIKVRNATGGSIAANSLVYFNGTYSDGSTNYPSIAKAVSTTAVGSTYFAQAATTGVIANNTNGTVAVFYEVSGVNTSSAAVGDVVYLDTTAGGWTRTRPTGGQYIQVIGTITVVSASVGRIVLSLGAVPEHLTGGSSGLGATFQTLTVQGASGAAADIYHFGDAGEDAADKWKVSVADGGVMTWENYTSGSYVAKMTMTSAGVVSTAGAITSSGAVTGSTLVGTVSTAAQNSITSASSLATVGTVTSGTWSGVIDGSATITMGSDATGDMYYRAASTGYLTRLAAGADGTVLTGTGAGSIPAWESVSAGVSLSGTTDGTIATVTGANALEGEANLTFNGSTLAVTGDTTISADLMIGLTSISTVGGVATYKSEIASSAGAQMLISEWGNDNVAGSLSFSKSRSASMAADRLTVNGGDDIGKVTFYADDGGGIENKVVEILAEMDNTSGAGDLPGRLTFWTATDGSTTLVERMRIDSAGQVGIGGAPTAKLNVYKSGGGTADVVTNIAGSTSSGTFTDSFGSTSNRATLVVGTAYTSTEGILNCESAGNSRLFVTAAGKVGIGITDGSASLNVKTITAITSITSTSTSATSKGMILSWSGVTPDNNTQMFLHCTDGTADRLYIYSDGDVANHDGTYGTISDVKFKQDIADVRSYWSDFKSLQYRKFRHKTDVEANADAPYRLGLIAQEVETIFPALVPESPDADIETQGDPILDESGEPVLDDDGNPTYETISTPSGTTHKWVKSSIVEGPIMGSVVQELQTRLEAAEAKITALESA